MLMLADVIEALTHTRPTHSTIAISEAVIDSREVKPGALFVAMRGENVDGHDYVSQAFRSGAILALIERDVDENLSVLDLRSALDLSALEKLTAPFCIRVESTLDALQTIARFWRGRLNIRVTGITGSVGKSTTKEVVAQVLSRRYRTLKNIGNFNNEIGLPLSLLRLTPEHQRAVLEMGFYVPGEIAFLCDIAKPSIGVVTNIGTVHAERAGSQDVIAQGKGELVEALSADGVAVLNYDDERVRKMASRAKARVFFYGLNPQAELWADEVESFGLDGIRFQMHYQRESLHVRVPLIGRHSVHTVLAASAVGLSEGLNMQEILEALQDGPNQLRLVAVRGVNDALILDDTYNASPESVLAALNLLDELAGRKIAVLGDMLELGQYEKQGHELVGFRAAQVADVLVTLGERAPMIANAARKSGKRNLQIFEFTESGAVTNWLRQNLNANDVALIKGSRGLQMERIVAGLEVKS
jgi:UDP-N-acetylmuramoyl-tripeptide--D-alanyl-D-alanine ligase